MRVFMQNMWKKVDKEKTLFSMTIWQKYKICHLCLVLIPNSKCNLDFLIMLFFLPFPLKFLNIIRGTL